MTKQSGACKWLRGCISIFRCQTKSRTLEVSRHTSTFFIIQKPCYFKKTTNYLYIAIKNISSPKKAKFSNKGYVFCVIFKTYDDKLHISIFNVPWEELRFFALLYTGAGHIKSLQFCCSIKNASCSYVPDPRWKATPAQGIQVPGLRPGHHTCASETEKWAWTLQTQSQRWCVERTWTHCHRWGAAEETGSSDLIDGTAMKMANQNCGA